MATLYVDSNNASPASPFDTWAKASITLPAALGDAACVAGSLVYVAHDHAETKTGNPLEINAVLSTEANPIRIICVNSSTGVYATTATISGTHSTYNLSFQNHMEIKGIQFYSARSMTYSQVASVVSEDCHFELTSNVSARSISVNGTDCCVRWRNCSVEFSNATQYLRMGNGGFFEWVGGSVTAGVTPLYLFTVGPEGRSYSIRGVDFSAVAIGRLVKALSSDLSSGVHDFQFDGCKLHADTVVLDGTVTIPGTRIAARSVDEADGFWHREEYSLGGVASHATNCKRTGGATYDGTNGFSAKVVTDANTRKSWTPNRNLIGSKLSTANPTIRVEIIHDEMGSGAGSDFQDDELWIEIEYPDSTDETVINSVSTRMAMEGTPADYPNSAATWTEDLGTEVKQYVEKAISDGAAGEYAVYLCVAPGAVKTVYACPQIEITAGS